MATGEAGLSRREQYRFVITAAGPRYASITIALILGLPVGAYISGNSMVLFYVHIGLAAFWFGMDFFFRYVLAPAVAEAEPQIVASLLPHLSPKIMVVGEALTLGTLGSGVGLAHRLGYLTTPTVWVWGALGIATVMLFIAFIPLHSSQTELLLELDSTSPDLVRVEKLNQTALRWLMGMTSLFLTILVMMVGMRGLIG
jgi:hypothetical protein